MNQIKKKVKSSIKTRRTKELVPKYWTSNISLPKILSSIFNNIIIKKGKDNNRDDAYNDYIKCFKSVG